MGFGVEILVQGSGSGFRVQGLGFRFWALGFMVQSFRFRV